MNIYKLCSIVLLSFSFSANYGQNIKRKILLGTRVNNVNDSIAQSHHLPDKKGIIILKVTPNTTASKLKLKENDVIIKINQVNITDKHSFVAALSTIREGEVISVEYIRNSKLKYTKGKAIAKPKETSENYEVIYDEIAFNSGYIRTIINKPKGINNAPAILFIPGYKCYSLDNIGNHPYGQLVDGLTKKGYVVIRVEKLGKGDCWNTPNCEDIDFKTEVSGFEKGLQSLKKYDFIDKENIFIWGHSLGAIEATIIAGRNKVKGIIVNGTTLYSWYEYLLKMERFQQPLFGSDYLEIEEMMNNYVKFQYEYLIQKKSPLELSENSNYTDILNNQGFDGKDKLYGRNYLFWQQLEDINQTKALKTSDAYVLSIWSSADVEAFSELEHKEIANIVNFYHPGKGTYVKLENTTHSFSKVESLEHGIQTRKNYSYLVNNFNPKIIDVTDKWIKKIIID